MDFKLMKSSIKNIEFNGAPQKLTSYYSQFQKNRSAILSKNTQFSFNDYYSMWLGEEFPTSKKEDWKYSDIKFLKNYDFKWQKPSTSNLKKLSIDELKVKYSSYVSLDSVNLFVLDGEVLNSKDLPKGMSVSSLKSCLSNVKKQTELKKWLEFFSKFSCSYLDSINKAFLQSGCLVKFDDTFSLESNFKNKSINFIYLMETQKFSNYRLLYMFGKQSKVEVIENWVTPAESLSNIFVNAFQKRESKVCRAVKLNQKANMSCYISEQFYLNKEAYLNNIVTGTFGDYTNLRSEAILAKKNSNCELMGLFNGARDQRMDLSMTARHIGESTESSQLVRSVLDDHSVCTFDGRILIASSGQKSSAKQLNQSLLLSETCEVKTKPQLNVYADDVKAAHGATVGALNQEEVFYLQTRGFSKKEAENILCEGYVKDLIFKVSSESVKDYLIKNWAN